jgi:hypothetical protein
MNRFDIYRGAIRRTVIAAQSGGRSLNRRQTFPAPALFAGTSSIPRREVVR